VGGGAFSPTPNPPHAPPAAICSSARATIRRLASAVTNTNTRPPADRAAVFPRTNHTPKKIGSSGCWLGFFGKTAASVAQRKGGEVNSSRRLFVYSVPRIPAHSQPARDSLLRPSWLVGFRSVLLAWVSPPPPLGLRYRWGDLVLPGSLSPPAVSNSWFELVCFGGFTGRNLSNSTLVLLNPRVP
jgi:hypothetical protein